MRSRCHGGFCVVQIQLGLVGLDLVLLVMGQELVSFKIVDAALKTEIASETACDGPCGSSAVIVALTVQDMSLRDMQVPALSPASTLPAGGSPMC